jgi:signal transduction histidine kinase
MYESDGGIKNFLTLGMPITERKLNEKIRNETSELLEKIAFRASHNIRGPMARIKGLSHLIERSLLNESEYQSVASKFAVCTEELNIATSELVNFVYDHQEQLNQEEG